MNEIKIFKNPQFGAIRTFTDNNGKLWFCGSDAAKGLGYARPSKAIIDHCKGVLKRDTPTNGGIQSLSYISEGDVYRLIAHSKLPSAERFESWVFDEIVPSVIKTGGYIEGQESMSDADLMAKALLVAQRQIEQRDKQLQEMQPKALFADSVCASSTSILIGELAKILKQTGVATGQNKLFAWMRDNGYLVRRKGADHNMPTQRSMEMQLFEIKETVVTHADGHTSINKTTKVTGKGQVYFVNKLCAGD